MKNTVEVGQPVVAQPRSGTGTKPFHIVDGDNLAYGAICCMSAAVGSGRQGSEMQVTVEGKIEFYMNVLSVGTGLWGMFK